MAGAMTATRGHFPPGDAGDGARRRAGADPHRPREELPGGRRQAHVRQALVRLPLGQRDPRRRAEPHPRADARSARDRRAVGRGCARPQVYEVGERRATATSTSRSRRRTASSAARSPRRAAADATRRRLRPGVHADLAARHTSVRPCLDTEAAPRSARTTRGLWTVRDDSCRPCLTRGVELADVDAAREAIAGRLHRTPMFSSRTLSVRGSARTST